MDNSVEDFLEHHGVPGMKWGNRRGAEAKPSTSVKSRREAVKAMSDKELQDKLTRMRNENEYMKLTKNGREKTTEWITKAALGGAAAVVTATIAAAGKKYITSKLLSEGAAAAGTKMAGKAAAKTAAKSAVKFGFQG